MINGCAPSPLLVQRSASEPGWAQIAVKLNIGIKTCIMCLLLRVDFIIWSRDMRWSCHMRIKRAIAVLCRVHRAFGGGRPGSGHGGVERERGPEDDRGRGLHSLRGSRFRTPSEQHLLDSAVICVGTTLQSAQLDHGDAAARTLRAACRHSVRKFNICRFKPKTVNTLNSFEYL